MKTITHNEFRTAATHVFSPHVTVSSYRCGRQRNIKNHTDESIQVKEYAPQAFAFYRELLSVSVESIESFLRHFWISLNQHQTGYHVLTISKKQKSRLQQLLPSLVVVRDEYSILT